MAQNIYITFIQRRPNIFDVVPTLYKWHTNVLCLLGLSAREAGVGGGGVRGGGMVTRGGGGVVLERAGAALPPQTLSSSGRRSSLSRQKRSGHAATADCGPPVAAIVDQDVTEGVVGCVSKRSDENLLPAWSICSFPPGSS